MGCPKGLSEIAFPKAQKTTLSSFPHSALLRNRVYISTVSEQCRIRLIRISLIQKIVQETGMGEITGDAQKKKLFEKRNA